MKKKNKKKYPKYAEGSAAVRGRFDQQVRQEEVNKQPVIDAMKFGLNALIQPAEFITGKDLYSPNYSTSFGQKAGNIFDATANLHEDRLTDIGNQVGSFFQGVGDQIGGLFQSVENGGDIYTYPSTKDKGYVYKKDSEGNWYVNNEFTKNRFKLLTDKERISNLEKGAVLAPQEIIDKYSNPFIVNYDNLLKGIAATESRSGKLMKNPESTASGLFGQLFSEIEDIYPGTRDEFIKDIAGQESMFKKRYKEGFGKSGKSLEQSGIDLLEEYKPQIEQAGLSNEDLAALINFLGRQGTRNYLGYHLRDAKSLADSLPNIYGPDAKYSNKTPEEYLEIFRAGMNTPYKKHGGHAKKYNNGADVMNQLLHKTQDYFDNQKSDSTIDWNSLANLAGNLTNTQGNQGVLGSMTPMMGGNQGLIGGIKSILGSSDIKTPQELQEELKYHKTLSSVAMNALRPQIYYSQDGANEFGEKTPNTLNSNDPRINATLASLSHTPRTGPNWASKIAQIGKLGANTMASNLPGLNMLGGNQGGGGLGNILQNVDLNSIIGMFGGSAKHGGSVSNRIAGNSRRYNMGTEVSNNNREVEGGENLMMGSAEQERQFNAQSQGVTFDGETLAIPETFEGYVEMPKGSKTHEEGGTLVNLPAEGEGNTTIEAEKDESIEVSAGESYVYSTNKPTLPNGKKADKTFKERKDIREEKALKIEKELSEKGDTIDPYRKNTLMRELMKLEIEDKSDREEQDRIKKEKEQKEEMQLHKLLATGDTQIARDGSYVLKGKKKKLTSFQKAMYNKMAMGSHVKKYAEGDDVEDFGDIGIEAQLEILWDAGHKEAVRAAEDFAIDINNTDDLADFIATYYPKAIKDLVDHSERSMAVGIRDGILNIKDYKQFIGDDVSRKDFREYKKSIPKSFGESVDPLPVREIDNVDSEMSLENDPVMQRAKTIIQPSVTQQPTGTSGPGGNRIPIGGGVSIWNQGGTGPSQQPTTTKQGSATITTTPYTPPAGSSSGFQHPLLPDAANYMLDITANDPNWPAGTTQPFGMHVSNLLKPATPPVQQQVNTPPTTSPSTTTKGSSNISKILNKISNSGINDALKITRQSRGPGDTMGDRGALQGAYDALANTEEMRDAMSDLPNVNYFTGVGDRSRDLLENKLSTFDAARKRTATDLKQPLHTLFGQHRDTASSFGSISARDQSAYNKYLNALIKSNINYDLMTAAGIDKLADLNLKTDTMKAKGDTDVRDKTQADIANYFTQKGADLQNLSGVWQNIAKTINENYRNSLLAQAIADNELKPFDPNAFKVADGGYIDNLASKGRFGDTELAHVNPQEKAMLEAMGGSGTINPETGLREYWAQFIPMAISAVSALTNMGGNKDEEEKKGGLNIPGLDMLGGLLGGGGDSGGGLLGGLLGGMEYGGAAKKRTSYKDGGMIRKNIIDSRREESNKRISGLQDFLKNIK